MGWPLNWAAGRLGPVDCRSGSFCAIAWLSLARDSLFSQMLVLPLRLPLPGLGVVAEVELTSLWTFVPLGTPALRPSALPAWLVPWLVPLPAWLFRLPIVLASSGPLVAASLGRRVMLLLPRGPLLIGEEEPWDVLEAAGW